MNRCILNIIHKMVQILQQFLVLGRKQGGDVETREPQTRGLSVNSIADSLSLKQTNKRKVRKCFKCVKEFSHRFDLVKWEIFVNFPRVVCKNCQGYIFCSGYQFPRKNLRENSPTQDR